VKKEAEKTATRDTIDETLNIKSDLSAKALQGRVDLA
jgi:hypothetical protein